VYHDCSYCPHHAYLPPDGQVQDYDILQTPFATERPPSRARRTPGTTAGAVGSNTFASGRAGRRERLRRTVTGH